jgi:hypothetical protein
MVNRYPKINIGVDCIFDSSLSMSFLHIGIADISQMIYTFNNPRLPKPVSEVT